MAKFGREDDALWRQQLRQLAAADGLAVHEPKPAPSRRGFWRAFLSEPAPVSNELPNFLTGDPQG